MSAAGLGETRRPTAERGDGPTPVDGRVYAYALEHQGIDLSGGVVPDLGLSRREVVEAVQHLVGLRLLCRVGELDYLAVSPEAAEAALIAPLNEELQRVRLAVHRHQSHLSGFRTVAETHAATAPPRSGTVLHGSDELSAYLRMAADRTEHGLVGLSQDPGSGLTIARSVAARGGDVRLLLGSGATGDLRLASALRDLVKLGAGLRIVCGAHREVMVFDSVAVYVTAHSDGGPAGVAVREPATVDLLRDMLTSQWMAATPYEADVTVSGELANGLHRSILEHLVLGHTDETVAARLGMSVRTCRRHIATVFAQLGARSRFQAGALAAAQSLVHPVGPGNDPAR